MSKIDYFKQEFKQTSQKAIFGLCDDIKNQPAYIDNDIANKDKKWLGEVHNSTNTAVSFHPIDNCIDIFREDKEMSQRCDGILSYHDLKNIIFVELKDRKIKDDEWREKAEGQIKESIEYFFQNYKKDKFNKIAAWICNRQLAQQNYYTQIKKFKEEMGMVLYICSKINVPLYKKHKEKP